MKKDEMWYNKRYTPDGELTSFRKAELEAKMNRFDDSSERVIMAVLCIGGMLGIAKLSWLGLPTPPGISFEGLAFATELLLAFLIFSPLAIPMIANMLRVSKRDAWKWFLSFSLGLCGFMLTAFLVFEWSGYA